MFVKVTTSGPRRYVQLVESYRDDAGRVKKRTVATLGRLDQLTGELDSVIDGLLKVAGREPVIALSGATPVDAAAGVSFESARALGNVWTLTEIWKELGFSDLRRVFRRTRHTIDVEALIRIMVLNRLCDPDSKLGVLRWLQTVALPDIDLKALTHQHLLRSMDALMEQQDAVDDVVAKLLRPLVDQDLSVAFYDMTTIRAEGLATMEGDVRQFGMAKEGLIARQFMLGVVQTSEGLPIYHEVFDGNTAETKTLLPILKKVMDRFPNLRRLILVADRGLLSLDNLEALQAIRLRPHRGQDPSKGQALEFIIAVPGRRYHEFADLLEPLQAQCAKTTIEITGEVAWNGLRMVVAHDPATALEQHQKRKAAMAELETQAKGWAGKLDDQDQGAKKRGRKLSDSGTKARFYHAVLEAHLGKIIKIDMKAELFSYAIDEDALRLAEMMDGKLLVVTNVQDMTPDKVIERYKSLADIERGFKVLKSELEIGPVYHRLPERIRAHASICFMALILHRVMRMRLRSANTGVTPERALQSLKRIQHHRVSINGAPPLCGVSSMTTEQHQVLTALRVKQPSQFKQLSLL
ncbi:MAG: IS1634 family transposase [Rhodoferax sp.]|uniref:IS1634 family transposase n=1 Tax=Rhodoferax sp. TaxID=50421 RepID=UPI001400EDC7|nr:IS1634 family transposase [Rhodoferax sp.]NDP39666.1 IS1634 family transposase [Rhodoferax sp.]